MTTAETTPLRRYRGVLVWIDADGDGDAEVIVVESDDDRGARLAIYDETGAVAATPFTMPSMMPMLPEHRAILVPRRAISAVSSPMASVRWTASN